MLKRFEETILKDFPDIRERNLYLAFSGGKDSVILSNLLSSVGLTHTLLHCNFNLRGAESEDDEAFVRSFAQEKMLPLYVKNFDTQKLIKDSGDNIQLTARNLRYEWFRSFSENEKTLILTAHHLDDSIETLIINLLRGTGLRGLKGIPRINHPFYRPLLDYLSSELMNYAKEQSLTFREDSSNADLKYLRNKIRHQIIPKLEEINPDFKSNMPAFFKEANDIDKFIIDQANSFLETYLESFDDQIILSKVAIESCHPIVLQFAFSNFGIKRSNFSSFLNFIQGNIGAEFLTKSHKFQLDRNRVFISTIEIESPDLNHTIASLPAKVQLSNKGFFINILSANKLELNDNPLQVCFDKVRLPITIRKWQHGDRIVPLGMSGSKLVSDILIDRKMPMPEKEKIVVIVNSNEEIIGIPGIMIGEHYKVEESSTQLIQFTFVRD